MPFKSIKNERGMALALVIMVMTVLIILGASILTSSLTETKFSVANEKNLQAEYIAKEGADIIAKYVIKTYTDNQTACLVTTTMALGIGKSAGQAEVQVSSIGSIYIIQSTGSVGNAQRTVKLYLRPLKLDEVFKGIWSTGSTDLQINLLDVSGNPIVQVPPGVNITGTQSGDYTKAYSTNNLRKVSVMIGELNYLSEAGGATTGSITASGDCKYSKINNVTNMTIDASINNTTILIKEVISNGDKHEIGAINVSGSGIVHLFINDSVLFKSPITGNGTLIIYIVDGERIDIQTGNNNGRLYIYAPDATVGLQCGTDSLVGAIVSKYFVRAPNVDSSSNGKFEYVRFQSIS